MNTSTPYNSREIQEKEKEMLQFLRENLNEESHRLPSDQTISNLVSYSKALSVKKSKVIGFIEQVLN